MEITCKNCIYYTIGDRSGGPDKESCTHPSSMDQYNHNVERYGRGELLWCSTAMARFCQDHKEFQPNTPPDYQEIGW